MSKAIMEAVYDRTLNTLNRDERHQQLWFQTAMKLCKDLLKERDYDGAEDLVERCHAKLKINGRDDLSKGSQLLEVYAVKMEVATIHQDRGDERAADQLQELFRRTSSLVA